MAELLDIGADLSGSSATVKVPTRLAARMAEAAGLSVTQTADEPAEDRSPRQG